MNRAERRAERRFGPQAALVEMTGIPARTWEHYRYAGGGPDFHRLPSGRVLYDLDHVLDWLDEHKVEGRHAS